MIRVLTDIEIDGNDQLNINSLKIGVTPNYSEIDTDGTLILHGNNTVWDDLLQPATTGRQGSNIKPAFNYTELTASFPRNNNTEILYFNIQLPHDWKEGSTIYPHVHFLQNQSLIPTFKASYRWIELGEVTPAWNTYVMSGPSLKPYTSGTMHQIVHGTGGIDGTGKTLSSMLQIKLFRDDNTYVGDCEVLSFDIHIEKDTLGSKLEFTK